ncbi:MAG: hypothetical protein ACREHD_25000 [Pirellulales bacterium]
MLGKYLLEGVVAERQKLQRGVFRCIEKSNTVRAATAEAPVSTRVFCAFDHAAGLLRFDQARDFRLLSNSVMTREQIKEATHDASGAVEHGINCVMDIRYFRTQDKSAVWHWLKGSAYEPSTVDIREPKSKDIPTFLEIFDVRGVGLYVWASFSGGAEFEPVIERLRDCFIEGVEKLHDGEYRVDIIATNRKRRTNLWIDEKQGFTVARREDQYIDKHGEWLPPEFITETKWEQRTGVWVPSTTYVVNRSRANSARPYGDREWRRDFNFDWMEVGASPGPELFSTQGLGVPKGTLVIDHRSSPPIMDEVVGRPGVLAKKSTPVRHGFAPSLLILIANALLLVIALYSLHLIHRRTVGRLNR